MPGMERCTGQPAGTPGPMRRGFADLPGRSIRRRAGADRAPCERRDGREGRLQIVFLSQDSFSGNHCWRVAVRCPNFNAVRVLKKSGRPDLNR